MRTLVICIWLCVIFGAISALFWYNDYVYRLPTPVPQGYKNIPRGQHIQLPSEIALSANKSVFLHFFNPDCPCSRFNMKHFKSLVKQYASHVQFVVVVINNEKYTAEQIRKKFDINLPVVFDANIASLCGVYSTPQAVILNTNKELYYRGNYNKNRYCTDSKTNYAEIALSTLLSHGPEKTFDRFALTAYGCTLTCNKN